MRLRFGLRLRLWLGSRLDPGLGLRLGLGSVARREVEDVGPLVDADDAVGAARGKPQPKVVRRKLQVHHRVARVRNLRHAGPRADRRRRWWRLLLQGRRWRQQRRRRWRRRLGLARR